VVVVLVVAVVAVEEDDVDDELEELVGREGLGMESGGFPCSGHSPKVIPPSNRSCSPTLGAKSGRDRGPADTGFTCPQVGHFSPSATVTVGVTGWTMAFSTAVDAVLEPDSTDAAATRGAALPPAPGGATAAAPMLARMAGSRGARRRKEIMRQRARIAAPGPRLCWMSLTMVEAGRLSLGGPALAPIGGEAR
jgi:hypothetical protein